MNAINLKRDWMFIISAILLFVYAFSYPVLKLWMFCLISILIILFCSIKNKEIVFDIQLIVLLITMIFIAQHDEQYYLQGETYKVIAPILACFAGHFVVGKNQVVAEKKIIFSLLAVTLGCYFQGVIDVIIKILSGNISEPAWEGLWGMYMSRTAYESNFLLLIAAMAYSVVTYKDGDNKLLKKVMIILGSISLLNSLVIMNGRTNVATFVVLVLLLMIIKKLKTDTKENNFKFFKRLGIGIAAVVVLIETAQKIYGINHDVSSSSAFFLFRNGGLFHNIRFAVAKNGLYLLFKYPQGGFETTVDPDITGTHNMWLEYGREFGLAVFLCLVIYNVILLWNICVCMKKDKTSISLLMFSMLTSLNIFFMLEPVQSLSDSSQLLLVFIIIGGMISQYKKVLLDNSVN